MKRQIFLFPIFFAALITFFVPRASAQDLPFLHPLFSDNMVLQRDAPAPVWGWTKPNQEVTVSFRGKSTLARAGADGKWLAKIGPFAAGGPYELNVSGPQSVTLKNVFVGDVWLCSGQSNMAFQLKDAKDGIEEITKADFPLLRIFKVPTSPAGEPQSTFKQSAQWQAASPASVKEFSAVAYFFGRHLHQNLQIPIGLIHTSAGATSAEAWSSADALKPLPDNKGWMASFDEWKNLVIEWDKYDADPALFERLMVQWYEANDPGSLPDANWEMPEFDDAAWKTMELPGAWGARSLKGFEGVVWFRREFEIPAAMKGKDVVLRLGNIDRRDTTWINGTLVGKSTSNGWRREYRVPANLLKEGRNVVAVRILGSGGFVGAPDDLKITQPENPTALSLAGSWRYKESIALKNATRAPSLRSGNPNIPTALYNGSIAPLAPFSIKGAIWYQGESNANNPLQYRTLLPAMIADWRARFGVGDFPFLIVQLANFGATHQEPTDTNWARFREVQAEVARTTPNGGLVVAIDIGEAKDIHPKNKQEIGKRLGLVAEALVYNQKIEYSGPIYQSLKIEGNKIRLAFDHAAGLSTPGGEKLAGFAIAGEDEKWVWADAVIEGESVVVSSPQIEKPVAVRYAWDDSPLGNLINKAGLPAAPFRTDDGK